MTARRLLLPFLLLFLAFTLLGSLGSRSEQASKPSSVPSPLAGAGESATVQARLPADEVVRARVGDIVELDVAARRPGTVEIPDLGVQEAVAPGAPAHFSLLGREPGRHAVRLTGSGERLGYVEFSER